jgi:multimeric flavodoxin WrbA
LNTLVILASARKNSDTQKLVELVFKDTEYTLIDLLDYKIEQYPADDEFLKVVDAMLLHQLIVFATPVYWYSMSGYMKVFFDRLTDIVSTQKHLGRRLKGKQTAAISVSTDEDLPERLCMACFVLKLFCSSSFELTVCTTKPRLANSLFA